MAIPRIAGKVESTFSAWPVIWHVSGLCSSRSSYFDATPATNYLAEQALRPAVVNRKMSAGDNTERGAKAQATLMTVLHSARKHSADSLSLLVKALTTPPRSTRYSEPVNNSSERHQGELPAHDLTSLPPRQWNDSGGASMRAAVLTRFRPGFHPRPTHRITLLTTPLFSLKDARGRCYFVMAFSARHPSSARVPRYLESSRCASAVHTVRPGAWQLSMLVTVLRADIHPAPILAQSTSGALAELPAPSVRVAPRRRHKTVELTSGRSSAT